ncbi:hypothetical protein J1614_004732 [Plenodomus biglobosus]|nr:hypothetical protein J1614_004732 [Plenodomus biglobosus]
MQASVSSKAQHVLANFIQRRAVGSRFSDFLQRPLARDVGFLAACRYSPNIHDQGWCNASLIRCLAFVLSICQTWRTLDSFPRIRPPRHIASSDGMIERPGSAWTITYRQRRPRAAPRRGGYIGWWSDSYSTQQRMQQ